MDSPASLVISQTLATLGASVVCTDGTNYSAPAAPLSFATNADRGVHKLEWRSEGPPRLRSRWTLPRTKD
eukprot:6741591-Prymnesium_polylepis.1